MYVYKWKANMLDLDISGQLKKSDVDKNSRKELEILKRKMAKIWKVVLAKFNVDYYDQGNLVITSCPVHNGSYKSSFNLNINEYSDFFGTWFCNSHKCHERYGRDMVGLTLGLLNRDSPTTFLEAVTYCQELTNDMKIDINYIETDNIIKFFSKERREDKKMYSRKAARSRLIIPAEYYIKERGFSPEVLDSFDVGFCPHEDSQMYNRVVFPVYDETGEWMVGCCGRRIDSGPDKWINSKGFSKSSHLYGYNKAIKRAKEVGALILVEGQGDVIRMHEAGISNTVGIFGSSLSDTQEFIIQKTGVLNIILAMDNDTVGQAAYIEIHNRLKDLFNVHKLELTEKDIGDMSILEVNNLKRQISRFV
jgi:5S rRNA maturation endonuclease (ribonuclease M5)